MEVNLERENQVIYYTVWIRGKLSFLMRLLWIELSVYSSFFTQAYADIKDVFYEKMYEEQVIYYKLYVKK